jgi:putative membrane protein
MPADERPPERISGQAPEQQPPQPSPSATRDLLANERTLLAWARTAIAIMGLGFVVARFGLLVRELAGVGGAAPRGVSTAFGMTLVLCGVLVLALAMLRSRRTADDILHGRVHWDSRLSFLLTGLLVLAGILLAAYLLFTG